MVDLFGDVYRKMEKMEEHSAEALLPLDVSLLPAATKKLSEEQTKQAFAFRVYF